MAGRVDQDLQCPTCLDIFKDPVILPCSHSFCRACLQQWWDREDRSCPVCRTKFASMNPLINLTLRNLCENLSRATEKSEDICNLAPGDLIDNFSRASVKSEDICTIHNEERKLFCLNHHELVCHICKDARIHAGHKFCPVDEALPDLKEKLRKDLQDAKQRLKEYSDCRENCTEQAEYIKVQREQVESKIKKDFEELHRFLWSVKEAKLSAVREEERVKSQTMKEKILALNREIATLLEIIRCTEELLISDHASFLNNLKTVITRTQEMPNNPRLLRGALLDEAKHVGNLKFSVWERMKEMVSYSPVILNPNTAPPELNLSEDLTSLNFMKVQPRPNNPERFKLYFVLGGALDSRKHMWDVDLGDNSGWLLGVAWGEHCLPGKMDYCLIGFTDGEYKTFDGEFGPWNPPMKPQRIRVHMDTDKKSVSFSESLTNTELFSENISLSANTKIFPYFYTVSEIPLEIMPLSPHVITYVE
ncbi:E3 ubiquitin-protein ligase TRIM39-like [Corythoichthys intestinalis]|uniref:E3 ubiquitin-protein ligase TRIM39-like n=1 Tax=Corythoichthys intestinalis TaxID=161448 RepID=UPI0025A5EB0A|nr:E3 ubiquitin-protein ligase TRIM39-like [Corythoichthys intestinalis]